MILRQVSTIQGLKYYPRFLSPQLKEKVLSVINSHPWCHRLKRDQQYYGIKYFQTKLIDPVLQPDQSNDHYPLTQLQQIIDKTVKQYNIFKEDDPPNQILVNKYKKRNNLGLHVQDTQAFGQIIAGVSIGSQEYLRLQNVEDRSLEYFLELEDCSCYVLTGQARHMWKHGIARTINEQRYKAADFERISLTVRHVIDSRRRVNKQDWIIGNQQ